MEATDLMNRRAQSYSTFKIRILRSELFLRMESVTGGNSKYVAINNLYFALGKERYDTLWFNFGHLRNKLKPDSKIQG